MDTAEKQSPPVGSVCMPASLLEWRKRGWSLFDGIDVPEKTATRVNPHDSSIAGLSYSLHGCYEGFGPQAAEKVFVRIDSWRFTYGGDTTDLPVMELIFDAQQLDMPARALESIKVMARPLVLSERVATRAINGALFLINQINAGQAPDFERVLELHRLHPDLNRSAVREHGKDAPPTSRAANANASDGGAE